MSNNSGGGFFSGLFDFSFSTFITPRIVSILYLLAIIGAGIGALFILIGGFSQGFMTGIGALILAPLVFFLYVLFSRVGLEALIVAFKTAENTRKTAENTLPRG